MEMLSQKEMLGSRIRTAREAAKVSSAELSRKIGISRAAVAQWETGQTEPSAANLRKVASVLNVTLEWLGQGRGTTATPRATPRAGAPAPVPSDGVLVDLKKLPAEQAKLLLSAMGGKNCEIWRLTSSVLAGAGYQDGDYLVVSLDQAARARDTVLVQSSGLSVFRVLFPPYLYAAPIGPQPSPTIVDNLQTVIRGVVVSRLSLT
jgi:transcriptional regulator with XRE-family HTH domain